MSRRPFAWPLECSSRSRVDRRRAWRGGGGADLVPRHGRRADRAAGAI